MRRADLTLALPVLAGIAAVVLLAGGDPAAVGPLGLVSAVPPLVIACLAVVVGTAAWALGTQRQVPVVLTCAVVLAVVLYAAPALIEHEPRFATAYAHAGFVERIQRTGEVLPNFDARFSWPGFFAAAAVVADAAGLGDVLGLLPWAPPVIELLYLPPVLLIARALVAERAVQLLAVLVFYAADWVGQDYFAPQAFAFLLYLVLLGGVLTWFRPRARGNRRRWVLPALVARLRFAPHEPQAGARPVLVLVLALLVAAMTVSHQLTPIALGLTTAALVACGLTRLRALPAVVTVAVMGWLAFAGTDFWVGHFQDVAGGVGDVGGAVGSNLGKRLGGSSSHNLVLQVRLGLTGAVWLAALWTFVRPGARRQVRAAAVVLAAAPFPVLALNSYGGEALLRVYLYALPFMAVLAAHAIWRPGLTAAIPRPAVAGAAVMALVMTFPIARYGNERFEMVRSGERLAVAWAYEHAPPGTVLYAVSGSLPWRYTRLEDYGYTSALPYLRDRDIAGLAGSMAREPGGALLLLTRGQLFDLEDNEGLGQPWGGQIGHGIATSRRLKVVFAAADALVAAPVPTGPLVPAGPTGPRPRQQLPTLYPERR